MSGAWLARAARASGIGSAVVAERMDIIPPQLRVQVTRRPKYACRAGEEGVVQALAPVRLFEGVLPTEATIADVIVGQVPDHIPLHHQAQIHAR